MKTWYKNWSIKAGTMSMLKELIRQYREDNYIDEDSHAHVLYNDGTILYYPDDAEKIKFKNIKNIHYMGSDDSRDFYFDDITTKESLEFVATLPSIYHMEYKNQLIIEDMEDYYRNYFNK